MIRIFSLFLSVLVLITFSSCSSKQVVSDDNSSALLSEISSVEEIPVVEKKTNIKLSFAGDMILACQLDVTNAGSFNEYTNNHEPSYFLEKVKPIFEKDDFTIVNLENVLTDRSLTPVEKDYSPAFWFKAKASNIEILKQASVEVVSLENNHTMDYGKEGYNDTVAAAENAGMTVGNKGGSFYLEKDGITIGVVCTGLWSQWNISDGVKRLEEVKQNSDFQIVIFHGGTEKIHTPDDYKVTGARTFVDNGADLVVGGHPHVLQPREIYNGVEIVYSVGNFCYGGSRRPENATVIYQMELTFDKDKNLIDTNSEIIPCYVYTGSVNNYQPTPIEDEEAKNKILMFMDGQADSPI